MPTRRAFLLQSAALCAASVVVASCKDGGDDARGATDPGAMPAVEFSEETPDLLITFAAERALQYEFNRNEATFGRGWYRRLFRIQNLAVKAYHRSSDG